MIVLGINGGVRLGYQDVSAVLIRDGEIIAAIEEERLNRVKFSPGRLSERSVEEVLKIGGCSIKDVDFVATHGSTWGDHFQTVLQGYFQHRFGHSPKIKRYHHHNCHSASTFYASGFDRAMILSIDNSGDGVSTRLSIGEGNNIQTVKEYSRPHSLGIFYSMITQFCGFTRDADEYKLMGLSSYGKSSIDLSDILQIKNGSYELDESFLKPIQAGQSQPSRQEPMYSSKLIDLLGPPRLPGSELSDHYMNIAASAQRLLEQALIELVTGFSNETGINKLCLAGGVALNCVANQKLMELDFIDALYVQPASGDSGISLGAAMLASAEASELKDQTFSPNLGSYFSNEAIEKELLNLSIPYDEIPDPEKQAAKSILENKIIGWFQGRSEFGPRALGNRSILANPAHPQMKDIINQKIKFREAFRPFCPSVLEEDASKYFEGKYSSAPHMTITYNVKPEAKTKFPSITHADGTARIQTVSKANNPIYYGLLTELKNRSGHGICINTSFNVKGQPMVNSPRDAIGTFFSTGMDELFLGNFRITKKH